MAGRDRIPMTSGVGITSIHLNPVLREHWLFTRFKELQGESASEEFTIIPITEQDKKRDKDKWCEVYQCYCKLACDNQSIAKPCEHEVEECRGDDEE